MNHKETLSSIEKVAKALLKAENRYRNNGITDNSMFCHARLQLSVQCLNVSKIEKLLKKHQSAFLKWHPSIFNDAISEIPKRFFFDFDCIDKAEQIKHLLQGIKDQCKAPPVRFKSEFLLI